jgi:hypothetical protein
MEKIKVTQEQMDAAYKTCCNYADEFYQYGMYIGKGKYSPRDSEKIEQRQEGARNMFKSLFEVCDEKEDK